MRLWSFILLTSAAKRTRSKDKGEGQPEPSPTNPKAQKSRGFPSHWPLVAGITNLRVVKRRRSTQDGDISPHDTKPALLTRRNLESLEQSTMPRQRKDPSASSVTDSTSTTDKAFGVQLNKNNIFYGRVKTKRPEDFSAVKEYLDRERESNSPDEEAYNSYVAEVEYADNELTVQSNTWTRLAKRPSDNRVPGYTSNYNFQWTEVDSHLTYGLSDAKPDISESFRRDQYPQGAVEALGGSLVPTQYSAAMPTFCVESKGPDGQMPSAEKQSAYDGALMVNAALETHRYMGKPPGEFFNKTQALTAAVNGEYVHLYGNHVVEKGPSLSYHQYPLKIHRPRDSLEDFKETYKQVRNVQDWARERATSTKDELHAYARTMEASHAAADSTSRTLATEWIYSVEHRRYYRITEGLIEWAPSSADRAMTPPSSSSGRRTKRRRLP